MSTPNRTLERVDTLIQVSAKLEEALKNLLANQTEFKQEIRLQIRDLNLDLLKKAEEIRDAQHLAESVRDKLLDFSQKLEDYEEVFKDTQESFKEIKRTVKRIDERKDKKIILVVQLITMVVSAAFAILVKFHVL